MGGKRLGLVAIVFVAALASGCGSDDDAASDVNQEMVDVFRAIGRANCHQWFKCCPPAELTPTELIGASEAECIQNQNQIAPAVHNVWGEPLAAGRIAFHVEQARACLAAIESATCTSSDASIDCDSYSIFEPRVSPGQTCAWSEECIGGFCDRDLIAGANFGKCVAKAPLGATCDTSRDCASGLCEIEAGGSHCIELRPNGESCRFDSECASGECTCEILKPDQVDCLGATGACGPAVENGCTLD
jgi:hypothetical protein